jgi:hypothetical protein
MAENRSMDPRRVTTEAAPGPVTRQAQPIALTPLQTTVSTLYTAKADMDFMIRHIWAANIDSSARTITVYLVPSGGTAADSNAVCKAYSIAANTTVRLDFLTSSTYGSLLQPGMSLQALASVQNVVNVGGWGQDIIGDVI